MLADHCGSRAIRVLTATSCPLCGSRVRNRDVIGFVFRKLFSRVWYFLARVVTMVLYFVHMT